MIEFRIGGRSITPANIGDSVEAALLRSVEEELRERIGNIRDPETGEFPVVVVKGRDIDHLSISIEGSAKLVEMVSARLAIHEAEGADGNQAMGRNEQPVAFLCHASEDKGTVRRLARDLVAQGIDVVFDEWEIRAGDSVRQKIDLGLERCTHFIAVLSPTSIGKPWVNSEMDAGFVRRMREQVVFIPLRVGLDVSALPPLLQGISAPTIDNYEADLPRLISDIRGLTRKPPLGPMPRMTAAATSGSGLSPAAEAIVKLLIERSEHGDVHDPQLDVGELRKATGLTDEDLVDAVDELEGLGLVRRHVYIGCGELGFGAIHPEGRLFSNFDSRFMPWDPAADALVLATKLMESADGWLRVAVTAQSLGWLPRRTNPALHSLIGRSLVDYSRALGSHPWATDSIGRTPATGRFVRGRGR